MLKNYAADPKEAAACKTLARLRGVGLVLDVLVVTLALLSTLRMMAESRSPLGHDMPTLFSYIWHAAAMFLGVTLMLTMGGRWILRRLLQSHLENGSILRLDDSVTALETRWDAEGREVAVEEGDRYGLQVARNQMLSRYENQPVLTTQ